MANTIQPFSKSITLKNDTVSCNILAEATQLTIMSGDVSTDFYCNTFNVKPGIADEVDNINVMSTLDGTNLKIATKTGEVNGIDYFKSEVDAISAVFSTSTVDGDPDSTLNLVFTNHTMSINSIDAEKNIVQNTRNADITNYIAKEKDEKDDSISSKKNLQAQLTTQEGEIATQATSRGDDITKIETELTGHIANLGTSLVDAVTDLESEALKTSSADADTRTDKFTNALSALENYCGSESKEDLEGTVSELTRFQVLIGGVFEAWKGGVNTKRDALLDDIQTLQDSLNATWDELSLGGKSISTLKDVKECTRAADIDVNTQVKVLDEGVSTLWKDMQELSEKFYDMVDASCGKSSQFTAEYPAIATIADLPVGYGTNTHKIVEIQDDNTLKLSDLAGLETYQSTDPAHAVTLTPYESFNDKALFIGSVEYNFQAVNDTGIQLLDATSGNVIILSSTSVTTGQLIQFVDIGDNTHRVLTIGDDAVTMTLLNIATGQNIADGGYASIFNGKELSIGGVERLFQSVDKGIQVLDAEGVNALRASDANVAAGQLIRFADPVA